MLLGHGLAAPAATISIPAIALNDPADLTVWPNQTSHANSDRWLIEHHDSIRKLQPRLLVLNFSNQARREHLDRLLRDIMGALGEASRYHGYRDAQAPVFLQYQVFKFVDLHEPDAAVGNSAKVPFKPGQTTGFNLEYNRFFSDDFTRYYGVPDPQTPDRFLRLDELVAAGYVHEVWFFAEHLPDFGAFEVIELKPVYDEHFVRQGDRYVQAGNGGDPDQRWTGRSVRIGFINASRGLGCYLESLSHGIEGMAHSRAIPYFTKYFYEFAGFDLKQRFPVFPHSSFYALQGKDRIDYPDPRTAVVARGSRTITISNYLAHGGNVHFLPNGRHHYDLDNPQPAMATIEDWRIGSGPNGQDVARPWTIEAFAAYRSMAPDCMGPWLVYWRQNFPGLDNRQKDDAGQPMKNWWPFLFY